MFDYTIRVYVTTPLMVIIALIAIAIIVTPMAYLATRVNELNRELMEAKIELAGQRVESLHYASEFAKWEAVNRTFAPVIDLEGLSDD